MAGIILLGATGATAYDMHGAISYNTKTGRYGWALDFRTQWEANRAAQSKCGYGCSVVLEFMNTCAALAIAPNGAHGWAGERQMLSTVEDAALGYCQQYSRGQKCHIVEAACTTRQLDPGDVDESDDDDK